MKTRARPFLYDDRELGKAADDHIQTFQADAARDAALKAGGEDNTMNQFG